MICSKMICSICKLVGKLFGWCLDQNHFGCGLLLMLWTDPCHWALACADVALVNLAQDDKKWWSSGLTSEIDKLWELLPLRSRCQPILDWLVLEMPANRGLPNCHVRNLLYCILKVKLILYKTSFGGFWFDCCFIAQWLRGRETERDLVATSITQLWLDICQDAFKVLFEIGWIIWKLRGVPWAGKPFINVSKSEMEDINLFL